MIKLVLISLLSVFLLADANQSITIERDKNTIFFDFSLSDKDFYESFSTTFALADYNISLLNSNEISIIVYPLSKDESDNDIFSFSVNYKNLKESYSFKLSSQDLIFAKKEGID